MNWVDTNLSRLVNFHYIVEFMAIGTISTLVISIKKFTNLPTLQQAGLLSVIVVFIGITLKIRKLRNKQLEEIKESIKEEWSSDISKETLVVDQKESYSHYNNPILNQIYKVIEQQAQHFKKNLKAEHKASQDQKAQYQLQIMQQGMNKAVSNINPKTLIPLTDNDFTLATKFGKSIAFLASDLPQQFLDDEWQWLDPTDKETYVPKAHYSHVVNNFERDLTAFTLRNHDGESHLELSYIVFILQNPEKFSPNQGYVNGGVDELIDWIQEAADISGWDELEKIINRIDLTDFRTSPMYS